MVNNWIVAGWIIDLVLNGIVWLIIAVFLIILIDVTDKWTRKAISLMDVADKWSRNVIEKSFEWIQKKNLNILFAFLLMLLLGILAQFEIIPKIIT
jgi:TRAP-type C4-dicarboxylate transport system permease small subunit